MRYPFQQLKDTNAPLQSELCEAARRVIDSGWYLLGEETHRFEEELAANIGTRHAVGTGNGLDALRLTFRAMLELGYLQADSEVIVPDNTFVATVLPLHELGFKCIACDIDPRTLNLDFSKLRGLVSERTAAVVPVHLYGTPAWDEATYTWLRDRGIHIVEDNAQAIGASVTDSAGNTRPAGSLGLASTLSFYPGKNIGALGDAGAVCTDDAALAECVRTLANYGSHRRYYHELAGYNSRLDELQAAFLRVKLRHLDEVTRRRTEAARAYDRAITLPELVKPSFMEGCRQVWHQYVVRHPERDRLMNYLADHGVGTMIHYPVPIHKQPCFGGSIEGHCPETVKAADEIISLPIANVSRTDATEIAAIINDFK